MKKWIGLSLIGVLVLAAVVWAATGTYRETRIPFFVNGTQGPTYDVKGATAMTIGSGDMTALTVTTDGTGNGELVLPDSSIGQDEVAGMQMQVILCGEMGNSAAHYASPSTGYGDAPFFADAATVLYGLGDAGCNAQDNGTEATADEVMYANTAFKVLGMVCTVSSSGSNGITINLRSAAADLTPDVTMTIATGNTTGATATATTTDIAAGATFALKTLSTEDLSAQDVWCTASIMLQP